MTRDSLSVRMLGRTLLDPVNDSLRIVQRLQENKAFRSYLQERGLEALPLLAGILLTSLALTVAAAALTLSANAALALLVMLVIVPAVLVGSFWVQAHTLLSWLEERSLARLLPRGRSRGALERWFLRHLRIDLGPPPRVPWAPALVFFLLPAAALASLSPLVAAAFAAYLGAAATIFAARDSASVPARAQAKEGGNLDFTARAPRPSLSGVSRRLRAFGKLLRPNLLPLVEYAALAAGLFFAASGRSPTLGIALVGAALLIAGAASIATRRMSFRFFGHARSGYAGAAAIIAGATQAVAGGLAAAAAVALAGGTWDAKLQALLANPWPLLVPLALLSTGAGLLLMRRPGRHFGRAGLMLFIVPKALTGAVALCTGIAVLAAFAWELYDADALLGFVRQLPGENLHHLQGGWHTLIAWLRSSAG